MSAERLWEQAECYFEKDGHARIFTLNRPEKLNSYTGDIIDGLRRARDEVRDDLDLGALIITGAGRAFSSGANMYSIGGVDEKWSHASTKAER